MKFDTVTATAMDELINKLTFQNRHKSRDALQRPLSAVQRPTGTPHGLDNIPKHDQTLLRKRCRRTTCCATALARQTTTAPIFSHLAHVFSQISTRDGLRPSVDGIAAAAPLSARSRQRSAGALTARRVY